MIIQVRGTSGSGKTWVMQQVIKALGDYEEQYIYDPETGRKRPRCYFFNGLVYVLGHYKTACGGCDGIGSARAVYDLTRQLLDGPDRARVILQEGLLLSEDVKWSSQLPDLRIVFLTTPVEKCIGQVKKRRAEAGNDKPLNENNTRRRVAVIERARIKLLNLGVDCRRMGAEQAAREVLRWTCG